MTSRYADQPRQWVPHPKLGMVETVRRYPPYYTNQRYVTRMMSGVDTMDLMAWREYGDPTDYWRIAEMNPKIVVPDDLTPGVIVHVPVVIVR